MIILSYNTRGLGKKEKMSDVKELIHKVRADMCCLQESKLETVTQRIIKSIWGRTTCDWEFVKSKGNSGGIISIWNPDIFTKVSSWSCKDFLVLNGFLVKDGKSCVIINIYAPNSASLRYALWDQLGILVSQCKDDCLCLIGDFNLIRSERERNGRAVIWNRTDMANFNNFIEGNNLVDLQLNGKTYTWYRPNGSFKSRLDRMIVNEEWVLKWPNVVLKAGRRTLSDHRPIFVEAEIKDWGPRPFRFFNH